MTRRFRIISNDGPCVIERTTTKTFKGQKRIRPRPVIRTVIVKRRYIANVIIYCTKTNSCLILHCQKSQHLTLPGDIVYSESRRDSKKLFNRLGLMSPSQTLLKEIIARLTDLRKYQLDLLGIFQDNRMSKRIIFYILVDDEPSVREVWRSKNGTFYLPEWQKLSAAIQIGKLTIPLESFTQALEKNEKVIATIR